MSGLYGKMPALFEDLDLSFYKLKRILSLAYNGKLNFEEKVDGFGCFFSIRNGETVIARNKTDVQAGGLGERNLMAREYAGGDKVKKTFVLARRAFENAFSSIPPGVRQKIFSNGTIWLNTELLGPAASNVIKYDKNIIKIHDTGHIKLDPSTNNLEQIDLTDELDIIDKYISEDQDDNFTLLHKTTVNLQQMSDQDLQIAKSRLNKLTIDAGLGDKDTIRDLLKVGLSAYVSKNIPHASKELIEMVVGILIGDGLQPNMPAEIPAEYKEKIKALKAGKEALKKKLISPLEDIIHAFSVELLKGATSAFLSNGENEISRLRSEAQKAIKLIQNSGNQTAIDILQRQLTKLGSIDNINSAIEGAVFEYEGKVYKFTGSFAPANQILGLVKYGRGKKVPPMIREDDVEAANKAKIVAIVPGSFKPPHGGHFNIAKHFDDMPEITEVIVFISPKERAGHSPENRTVVSGDMSLNIWNLYRKYLQKTRAVLTQDPSPITATYDYISKMTSGDTVIVVSGEKDSNDNRFNKAQEYADKTSPGITVKIMNVPEQMGGISGTDMRELIASNNKDKLFGFLPSEISPEEREEVWEILSNQSNNAIVAEKKTSTTFQSINENKSYSIIKDMVLEIIRKKGKEWCVYSHKGKNLGCSKTKADAHKRLGQVEYFKKIGECSSMSGGAVQGGGKSAAEDPNHSIIREEELEEDYQADITKHHEEKKKELIGKGNQTSGSDPYLHKPSYKRSKSAPPGAGGA